MNVLAVMGSPRERGNTYRIVKGIEERMEALGEVDLDYLFLADADLKPCRGCGLCLARGEDCCPLKDDREEIEGRMLSSDGVIFATPVYAMNVTALMKNFIDRFAYTLHRPRFFDQYAMIVSTAGAIGLKEATDRMAVMKFSGFDLVHAAGFVTPGGPISKRSRERIDRGISEAADKLFGAMSSGRHSSPGLINLIAFRGQQSAFSLSHGHGLCDADYSYFNERGWLHPGRRYYTDVDVNPLKNAIAVAVGRMAGRNMQKELQGSPW